MSHPLLDYFATQSSHPATSNTIRFSLSAGESRVLPHSVRHFRVLSGKAWVAFDSEDLIVRFQETLHLRPDQHSAIIRPLGPERLELETSA